MANVNYVYERESFIRHARDNGYTGNEQLFWYAMFTIFNERANRNTHSWPDGFVRVTNKELLSWLPFTENTLNRVRADFVNPKNHQPILVEYLKGRKNEEAPQYKMNYFSDRMPMRPPMTECDNEDETDFNPKSGGNMGGNMGGKVGGNMGGKMVGNMGAITLNVNQIQSRTNQTAVFPVPQENEEEDEEEEAKRAYANAAAEVRRVFTRAFGRMPTPEETRSIAATAILGNLCDVTGKAIETAARSGANAPALYVCALLDDWRKVGICTEGEAEEYLYLRAASAGKTQEDPEEARQRLIEYRPDRTRDAAETKVLTE